MLIIIGAILGFIAVVGVGFALTAATPGQAKTTKRVQAIARAPTNREVRARAARAAANTPDARRKAIVKTLKDQEKQAKKAQLTLSNKLLQAGLTMTPGFYYGICAGLGVTVMLLVVVLRQPIWAAPVLGAAIGVGLPRWIVNFLANGRIKKFTSAFSDAMDIIVRGIKSGLPVHDCLKIIGRETPQPLAGEFQRLMESIGMGMSFDQALEKMYDRMPTPELRFFSIVMNVQQKTGGNLAEALGNLSTVLRARKLMREKIKALSSEATASAMIIGCLPPGVVVLISVTQPGYMFPMFHDPRGQLMMLGGVTWMSMGIFVMRRMINFKF
ncbi:type II secretion system F family protein [Caulobacter sp. KR2-114]|uniref:type II secretion system F family protein n=1 Tax=Caulobacter sp. KR2-114 TaxID=3400912 RepID=UPI003BFEC055